MASGSPAQGSSPLTVDIKDVIQELSAILDPKHVHWTVRVARAIGRTRPAGQLANFLGVDVVTTLWGTIT
jgi:hypothetical protein